VSRWISLVESKAESGLIYLISGLEAESQQIWALQVPVSAELVTNGIAQRDAVVIGEWCGRTSRKQSSVQSDGCSTISNCAVH
jgi:hypothetical protein